MAGEGRAGGGAAGAAAAGAACGLKLRLQPAGHILGSACGELDASWPVAGAKPHVERVVFSGDLGAPYTPLLPAPQPPASADVVVMESTYGDNLHEGRKTQPPAAAGAV